MIRLIRLRFSIAQSEHKYLVNNKIGGIGPFFLRLLKLFNTLSVFDEKIGNTDLIRTIFIKNLAEKVAKNNQGPRN